eukprot:14941153-Alexandrium_andersonii.AAC.1
MWFVSHYWGMPTRHFVESVKRHAQQVRRASSDDWRSVAYWMCTYSNNQWKVEEEMGADCETS